MCVCVCYYGLNSNCWEFSKAADQLYKIFFLTRKAANVNDPAWKKNRLNLQILASGRTNRQTKGKFII